jgi:hypothetical protein
LQGGTLVHAAAGTGDNELLEDLVWSPYCAAQLTFSRSFSPFIHALINDRLDTMTTCLQVRVD